MEVLRGVDMATMDAAHRRCVAVPSVIFQDYNLIPSYRPSKTEMPLQLVSPSEYARPPWLPSKRLVSPSRLAPSASRIQRQRIAIMGLVE